VSNPSIPPVPPGSTPLRELARAVAGVLTLTNPATRITRDRARRVRQAMRDIPGDRETGTGPRDVMVAVASLREQAADLPGDAHDHAPQPS
jgi:hypothetical protein